ncbi:BatD family protein [Dyella psychrodurans]|uniref:Protein BatD n=1 Tax=Dyella psychrodurans TaxID=1927960 RepID=A0A370X2V0_9GAMM|nr:BatD family protein [Dyella psychrodurans]RDS82545.1 protein BatD [Dyella psychrodurans]
MSRCWLLLCLLFPLSAMAGGVQATLDRGEAHLGETVTLNLRIDGSTSVSTPDLSALDSDFEVLGTSENSSLTIDNGRQTAQMIIGIALRPKHVGDLRIPPLTVAGSQTAPLTLHVSAPDNSASSNSHKDIFIETTTEPGHVYVGQQLVYTVRLLFDVNLNSGTLPDPHPDNADVRQLGNDIDYESERNGRRYHVVERHYAIIPHHAGTLTIPSVEFQGEAVDPADPNDPRGLLGQGGLFGDTTPVTADSTPVSVDVQAAPSNWGGTTWLPARSLSLSVEGLPPDNQVHVGQPINVHMSVQATGLSADALPEPSLPIIDDAKVYPDQPTDTTHDDGQWLTGRRERSFAIFPQQTGTLTIPAITLTWFDVQSGQKQLATVPARTLTVLPAANAVPAGPSPSTQTASATVAPATGSSNAAAHVDAAPSPAPSAMPWRWIAIVSIGMWVLSMVTFLWLRRSKRASTSVVVSASVESMRALRHAFFEAARGNDIAAQAHRLLDWARAERPALQNLGQLQEALASDRQRHAIGHLQRQQFAGGVAEKAVDLADVFADGFVWHRSSETEGDSPLPPLYPFKLD